MAENETTTGEIKTQGTETEDQAPEVTLEPTTPPEDVDEVVITIGDALPQDEEPQDAPAWVKDLRRANREAQRENRELRQQLEQVRKPDESTIQTLGPRPTLEQFEYDSDKYDLAVDAWHAKKIAVDAQKTQIEAQQADAQQKWQGKIQKYHASKSEIKVKDFDDAEGVVMNALDAVQQGIIIHAADNPATLVYALGKNPEKLAELVKMSDDPVKFTVAVARLEMQVRSTPKKPPPEKTVTGSGTGSASSDATLERLRAEAAKTGDFSKVVAYNRQQRKK